MYSHPVRLPIESYLPYHIVLYRTNRHHTPAGVVYPSPPISICVFNLSPSTRTTDITDSPHVVPNQWLPVSIALVPHVTQPAPSTSCLTNVPSIIPPGSSLLSRLQAAQIAVMSAASMDMDNSLGAFAYLSENLPAWISELADLTSHTAVKRQEYVDAYRREVQPTTPRRRKSGSIRSTQPVVDPLPPSSSVVATRAADSTPAPTAVPSAHGIPRKRKCEEADLTDPDERSVAGAMSKTNPRCNVIIHYDGHTQKVLEEMVRGVGIARSYLRRGKMAQSPEGIGLLGRTKRLADSPASLLSRSNDSLLSGVRRARSRQFPDSPFDLADRQLEVVHGLCENAAYQVLRAGECTKELRSVEEKLNSLLRMSMAEVSRLSERNPSPVAVKQPMPMPAPLSKPTPPVETDQFQTPGPIEVDDASSVSVESIDIAAFRTRLSRHR